MRRNNSHFYCYSDEEYAEKIFQSFLKENLNNGIITINNSPYLLIDLFEPNKYEISDEEDRDFFLFDLGRFFVATGSGIESFYIMEVEDHELKKTKIVCIPSPLKLNNIKKKI